MPLTPLDPEQIQRTAQVMLSYLDDPENKTPNNMLEGIVSGKSLLRGITAGALVLCEVSEDAKPTEVDHPAKPRKKRTKKKRKA